MTLLERYEEDEHAVGEESAVATEVVAGVRETGVAPVSRHVGEDETTLFAVEVGMYELKAVAEELPPVQIPRRAVRRRVAEQLLLWPDADEPLAGAEGGRR